jgi:low temperature requirement protein LtrA
VRLAAIRPPRLRTVEEEGERTATWLELFYDLVFVAVVAALGTRLASDTAFAGWASYAAYFTLVWWLWASHTFYADRFDTDDLVYRLLATAQMIAIAIIAASVSTGDSGSTVVFAAAYAAARIVLLLLYARVYRHVVASRPLVRGYLIGFGTAAAMWAVSVFVPTPWRFWLWGLAFVIDVVTPYVMRKEQARVPLDVSHLPERFGLFTILVLGETIVAVTVGLGHVQWQTATTISGVAGLLLASGIWWIHFDNVDGFVVRRRGAAKAWRPTVWIYTHLPLAIGLAMVGVGIEHAIIAADHDHLYYTSERWVLVAGTAIAFAAIATIEHASIRRAGEALSSRVAWNRLYAVPVVLAIGLTGSGPAMTVVLLAVVCVAEVVADIIVTGRFAEPEPEEAGASGG